MSELHIPDEARALAQRVHQAGPDGLSVMDMLEKAAPIVLASAIRDRAAYYRNLTVAEESPTTIALHHVRAEALDTWADELAGGTR